MKRMKSDEVRKNWADVLQHVRTGGTVIVEHYNRPIARLTPIEENAMPARTETYKHRDLISIAIALATPSRHSAVGEYYAPTTREGLTKPKQALLDDGLIRLDPIPGRDDRALLRLTAQGRERLSRIDVAEVDEAIAAHNRPRHQRDHRQVTGAEVLAYHRADTTDEPREVDIDPATIRRLDAREEWDPILGIVWCRMTVGTAPDGTAVVVCEERLSERGERDAHAPLKAEVVWAYDTIQEAREARDEYMGWGLTEREVERLVRDTEGGSDQ